MPSSLSDEPLSELPRVGRYEILHELEDEGFVSVMAARVRGPNAGSSIVELTKIEHGVARSAEVRAAFLSEARAAGRVRHANFLHPTDTLVHDGELYSATEFTLGVRLDELWRAAHAARFEIPLPVMLRILLDVISGLSALHARHPRGANVSGPRSIVHGDVAPTNILVSYKGDAKLIHSGLSTVTSLPGIIGQRNRRLPYKAPEQLRLGVSAVAIGPAADVFAVGALLWEVLQGRKLFDGDSDVEVVERILHGTLAPIEPGDRRIPIALLPLVEMALERTPERRIPNAAQLGDAIEHAPGVRLATHDEVALVVDQLVGPLIERRRERVNELFALAESRSPSDSTLRPAIISHLRRAGGMKTPVGLVYPPPSGAPLSGPTSGPPSSFVPSDRWVDTGAPPSPRFPSNSRWAISSSDQERPWGRSGSIRADGDPKRSILRSGWLYYLAVGAVLGGLVFEYFIEAGPASLPQTTIVLTTPPGVEPSPTAAPAAANPALIAPAVPGAAGTTTANASASVPPAITPMASPPPPGVPVGRPNLDMNRRPPPVAVPSPPRAVAPPRVRRPTTPPETQGTAPAAPAEAPASPPSPAPTPAPAPTEEDWGI